MYRLMFQAAVFTFCVTGIAASGWRLVTLPAPWWRDVLSLCAISWSAITMATFFMRGGRFWWE